MIYKKLLEICEKVKPLSGGDVVSISITANSTYLGEIKDSFRLIPVQILKSDKGLGWLYSGGSGLFKYGGSLFEFNISSLKDLSEGLLKEKKWSNEPKENHIKANDNGEVYGYIGIVWLLRISQEICKV